MTKTAIYKKYLFYILSTIIIVIWLIPFVIAVLTSFKTMDEISFGANWFKLPEKWSLEGYITAWKNAHIYTYYLNTFLIAAVSTLGALFLSSLGAYALSWYDFKLRKPILIIFVAGMLIPFQMLLIPVYKFSVNTGLYDTYPGLILFHIAFQLGFCTFFLRNFMITIPKSIFEAARIDGANDFKIYYSIMLPLIKPAIAALGILEFTWIWNDYLWALILIQSDTKKPITLGLTTLQGQWVTSWNVIAAASILAAIVPIIVFLMFQKYFIQGLTMGSVKG
ncbi:carbohydrate ABC transporter permease [Marinitoga sp. 38H-ov]|uniref:carbohydrate ABC transporter permease n=1 Tax=Marinitoga sp. 38H-ov TaxID=1755814 RepID=UPI0013E9E34D|nr:carbohydrate ABC transporter permease [Marinitoga sp. 38H-ov]KAF2956702.1 sugar ABC transporter permease [Marinitoga sp. 38H-ov]